MGHSVESRLLGAVVIDTLTGVSIKPGSPLSTPSPLDLSVVELRSVLGRGSEQWDHLAGRGQSIDGDLRPSHRVLHPAWGAARHPREAPPTGRTVIPLTRSTSTTTYETGATIDVPENLTRSLAPGLGIAYISITVLPDSRSD